jgi:hypothetical protein
MKLALAGALALFLQVAPLAEPTAQRAEPARLPAQADDSLYDELAQRWLKRHGVADPKDLRSLLSATFARLSLGLFDVYLPVEALKDGKVLEDARGALVALLDAQRTFGGWVQGNAEVGAAPANRKDDPLAKWLLGLTPKTFAGRERGGLDLAEVAPDYVRSLLSAFRTENLQGGRFGVNRALEPVALALFPRRAEFVEFTCVAGALDPALRTSAWNEGVSTWLEYEADGLPLFTLEYTAGGGVRDYERGVSVGARNPQALAQLVAQVGTRALLRHVFADGLDPALGSGMANALVIDLYGELDTRIDGDVRARSSQGRSIFVPGGNPNGGVLPPTSAENRWRECKGRDHFVGVLAQVQKQSGKKAPTRAEKLARFELVSDDGSKRELVTAPFLGPKARQPNTEVWGDYLELVRCYGVAFLHWLRVEGAGKPAESAARFGELLRTLGRVQSEDLPRVLQEIYGQPLSAEDLHGLFDGQTLEGRFLAWLSRKG